MLGLASSAGFGIAVAAHVILFVWLARRYGRMPARYPLATAPDGSVWWWGPRAAVWLAPAVIGGALALTAALVATVPPKHPPRPADDLIMGGVFLIFAEAAALLAWVTRVYEQLGRGQRTRVPQGALLRATIPLLATVALVLIVAVRAG